MALPLVGRVGEQSLLADGSEVPPALGSAAQLLVSILSAKYRHAVEKGRVFSACVAKAGVAPGLDIDTTATFSLWNPANSGRRLVLLRASIAYISGTLGAGAVLHCGQFTGAAPSSGTAITPKNALIGSAAVSVAEARAGSTLAAAASLLRPFASLTALLASTAVAPYTLVDDLDGEFVVDEGAAYVIDSVTAAGSTPLIIAGALWEEVPV